MLLLLALLLGGTGIYMGIRQLKEEKRLKEVCNIQTPGVVVRVDKSTHRETYTDHNEKGRRKTKTRNVTSYYSVFEYAAGEQIITRTAKSGSNKPQFQVGEQVTVFYNPDKPEDFYVSEDTLSTTGVFVTAFGVVILVGGFVAYFI